VRVVAATKNEGKLRELRAVFAPLGWVIEADPRYVDPPEGETSYEANAALKARALRSQLAARGESVSVLGDDSGLEVAALGGRPGVLSARYGGDGATWPERRARLLRELSESGDSNRSARFICALHFISEDGRELAVTRDRTGRIATAERGEGGFSYDAIFEYPPLAATFAELTEEEKNAVSHRSRAAQALRQAWDAQRESGVDRAILE
jgi:XTP/dITP diphosphohydrolase